ncbi:hypothetical protein C8Q76DRAFT_857576 [Earliella scabrosa]|nr:hypothetical protein C8Q76DRAFT_857576 [Earliella scabrosa]
MYNIGPRRQHRMNALFIVSSLLAAFRAARAQISTPLITIDHVPAQCESTTIHLSHGEPPYSLTISYLNNTDNQLVSQHFTDTTRTSIPWLADLCGGTLVSMNITDTTGAKYNSTLQIYLGSNSTCLSPAQLASDACLDPPPVLTAERAFSLHPTGPGSGEEGAAPYDGNRRPPNAYLEFLPAYTTQPQMLPNPFNLSYTAVPPSSSATSTPSSAFPSDHHQLSMLGDISHSQSKPEMDTRSESGEDTLVSEAIPRYEAIGSPVLVEVEDSIHTRSGAPHLGRSPTLPPPYSREARTHDR